MRRLLLMLTLAIVPAFCGTPCVEQAKVGKVGQCLTVQTKATLADAQFVSSQPVKGYTVIPDLPYNMTLEFSTREQADAIVELINFAAPGSKLVVKDVGDQFNFPPFRVLQYVNAGGYTDARIYSITGTIKVGGEDLLANFEPGWFINVIRLIFGGSFDTQTKYPWGRDRLIVVKEFGGASPKWVGLGTLNPDGTVTQ